MGGIKNPEMVCLWHWVSLMSSDSPYLKNIHQTPFHYGWNPFKTHKIGFTRFTTITTYEGFPTHGGIPSYHPLPLDFSLQTNHFGGTPMTMETPIFRSTEPSFIAALLGQVPHQDARAVADLSLGTCQDDVGSKICLIAIVYMGISINMGYLQTDGF